MTNEINKIISKVNYQESKTSAGANRVPQKQDTVTLSVGPSKIKDLKESKELLEIQKKLRQLLDSWTEGQEADLHANHGVYGPVDLKSGTNAEIIKKLTGGETTEGLDLNIICGKRAAEAFKDVAGRYCSTDAAAKKMGKIIGLLESSVFKRTVYVCEEGTDWGDFATDYLLGITKDNKMLGVFLAYLE